MSKAAVLKAIRQQCTQCMGNHPRYVKGCTSPNCPLFPYRLGSDPAKRVLSEEECARRGNRLKQTRYTPNLCSVTKN